MRHRGGSGKRRKEVTTLKRRRSLGVGRSTKGSVNAGMPDEKKGDTEQFFN